MVIWSQVPLNTILASEFSFKKYVPMKISQGRFLKSTLNMISISYTTKATGLVAISQKSSHALCSRVVCVCTTMHTAIKGA